MQTEVHTVPREAARATETGSFLWRVRGRQFVEPVAMEGRHLPRGERERRRRRRRGLRRRRRPPGTGNRPYFVVHRSAKRQRPRLRRSVENDRPYDFRSPPVAKRRGRRRGFDRLQRRDDGTRGRRRGNAAIYNLATNSIGRLLRTRLGRQLFVPRRSGSSDCGSRLRRRRTRTRRTLLTSASCKSGEYQNMRTV